MMYRDVGDRLTAIPQPSHAWLSGQAMRAWGNAEFGRVTPFEDVCLGAEQHDIGWLPWENAPTLNAGTGRPHAFREMDIATHAALWTQGVETAAVLGRYPALLVSLHGSGLYRGFDLAAFDAAAVSVIRDFLARQDVVQRRLIDGLAADPAYTPHLTPAAMERNRLLVSAVDRLSIAICTGLADVAVRTDENGVGIIRNVPAASGAVDLRITALDRACTRFTVSPWPFAASAVTLFCEGIPLSKACWSDEAAMRQALYQAPRVTVAGKLRAG